MSDSLGVLEVLARGGAAAVLTGLALSLARDVRSPARATGALFCLGAAGHALTQSREIAAALGPGLIPAWLFSVIAGGLFWAFAMELFGDSPRLRPQRFAPAALLLAISLVAANAPTGLGRAFWLAQNLVNAALMLHVLFMVGTGFRNDLVEPRRRLRGPVIAVAGLYALAVSGVQATELFSHPATQLSASAAGLLLALSIAGAVVFQQADEGLFGPPARGPARRAKIAVPVEDSATLERLRRALDVEEVWRQESLAIGALAQLVGAPEHRLRKIINEGLGYRNFAALLNERRIGAAKAALADPANGRKPVSAIAYEVGFSSLATFNRVFREIAGQTPTAWRQAALAGSSNSSNPPQN